MESIGHIRLAVNDNSRRIEGTIKCIIEFWSPLFSRISAKPTICQISRMGAERRNYGLTLAPVY